MEEANETSLSEVKRKSASIFSSLNQTFYLLQWSFSCGIIHVAGVHRPLGLWEF